MKFVKPYIDENKQIIFIEMEKQTYQDVVNGFILGLLFWGSLILGYQFLSYGVVL